ncbi:MAG: tetratricopeptide repeat protein [Candidatus Bathyarchaeia archaeon]
MSVEKDDPIKLHKEGNTLYETGKYEEAAEKFLVSSELYEKKGNFFDASNMMFRAGECSFMQKDYETAIDRFNKSAETAFNKGFDRFGVSALEYIFDCYKALKKEKSKKAVAVQKKIKEVKDKLASQLF